MIPREGHMIHRIEDDVCLQKRTVQAYRVQLLQKHVQPFRPTCAKGAGFWAKDFWGRGKMNSADADLFTFVQEAVRHEFFSLCWAPSSATDPDPCDLSIPPHDAGRSVQFTHNSLLRYDNSFNVSTNAGWTLDHEGHGGEEWRLEGVDQKGRQLIQTIMSWR